LYQHWRLSSSARDVRMFGMVICVAQERSGYVCQNESAMAKEIPQKTCQDAVFQLRKTLVSNCWISCGV